MSNLSRWAQIVRPVVRALRGPAKPRPTVTVVDVCPLRPTRRFEVGAPPSREE